MEHQDRRLFTVRATVVKEPYENVFTQFVRLRFGRIAGYEIYEDSPRFWRLCQRVQANGVAEAVAPPITDSTAGTRPVTPYSDTSQTVPYNLDLTVYE